MSAIPSLSITVDPHQSQALCLPLPSPISPCRFFTPMKLNPLVGAWIPGLFELNPPAKSRVLLALAYGLGSLEPPLKVMRMYIMS